MNTPVEHSAACYCCWKTGPDLKQQYLPGPSGPGWIRYACDVCAALPSDPELIPAGLAHVLALRATRAGRAS